MQRLHKRAANVTAAEMPKCAACHFGKQTNRVAPGTIGKAVEARRGVLSADKLPPGERVFVDHFLCAMRGRKFTGDGKHNCDVKSARPLDVKTVAAEELCLQMQVQDTLQLNFSPH